MRVYYAENNTKIYESYKLTEKSVYYWSNTILNTRRTQGLLTTRTAKSYANEIKVHNWLYKKGVFKKRTADCDLEEPIKKPLEILYNFLGRML